MLTLCVTVWWPPIGGTMWEIYYIWSNKCWCYVVLLICVPPIVGGFNEKLHFIDAMCRNYYVLNLRNLNVAWIIWRHNANFQLSSPPWMSDWFKFRKRKSAHTRNCLRIRTLSRGTTLVYNFITEITSHVRHCCDTLGTIMGAPNVFYFGTAGSTHSSEMIIVYVRHCLPPAGNSLDPKRSWCFSSTLFIWI